MNFSDRFMGILGHGKIMHTKNEREIREINYLKDEIDTLKKKIVKLEKEKNELSDKWSGVSEVDNYVMFNHHV